MIDKISIWWYEFFIDIKKITMLKYLYAVWERYLL